MTSNSRSHQLASICSLLASALPLILSASLQAQGRPQGMIHNATRSFTGGSANDSGYSAVMSGNGRYVAFDSDASDLVPGDTNGFTDVFVRDMQTGSIIRVSVSNTGAQSNGDSYVTDILDDGRFVVFDSDATNLRDPDNNGDLTDVFIADILGFMGGAGSSYVTRVTNGNDAAWGGQVAYVPSGGRLTVAYLSDASNEVSGDTNGLTDIFIRDILPTSQVRRVSRRPNGAQITNGTPWELSMSSDARFIAFTSDSTQVVAGWGNGLEQAFLVDNVASVFTPGWLPSNSALSGSPSGTPANSGCWSVHVSDYAHSVFASDATNIVAGDTNGTSDAFFKPYFSPTSRLTVGPGGLQTGTAADIGAESVALSDGPGPLFVFETDVTGIVPGDTNGTTDTFVGAPSSYSRVRDWEGQELADGSYAPSISADGLHVAVFSWDARLPFNTSNSDGPFVVDYNRFAAEGPRTANSVQFEFHCAEDNGLHCLVAVGFSSMPGIVLPGDTRMFPISQASSLFISAPVTNGVVSPQMAVPSWLFGSGFTAWITAASLSTTPAASGLKGMTNPVRFVL